jgi:transcriptional regulator with XRE-family HTH domain
MVEAVESGPGGVGARIRSAREARGWTQGQLAEAVGVSRSAVAQWETERAGQVRANIARVARALDVSIEYLLIGAGPLTSVEATTGDELALLRLYRACEPEDRAMLLRTARRLARR